MSAPPPDADPPPDDDDLGEVDLPEGLGDADPSGEAASDPESARREAEDALAEIEALADLDTEPDVRDHPAGEAASSSDDGPTADAASASGDAPEDAGGPDASGEGPPEDQCENCGALLHGPYCSQCGQKAATRIMPVWHMINEALEAVVELDLRVLYTLPKFLFLPGRLTKEYINGRRKRYIRPFRLYLFSTFVLFAVLALTTTTNIGFDVEEGNMRVTSPDTAATASLGPDAAATESARFGSPEQREKEARQLASALDSLEIDLFSDPQTNERFEQVIRAKVPQAVRYPKEFMGNLIDQGPYLMFLMLPAFALLLKLLYVRRGRLYAEHMIFSLHVHAFSFFAFTVGILLEQSAAGWLNTAAVWVSTSPLLYLVLAMSHVYDQGLIRTLVKAAILLLTYLIILSFGVLLLTALAILFM